MNSFIKGLGKSDKQMVYTLVYTLRIKNWEREEVKILSMVLETKNRLE